MSTAEKYIGESPLRGEPKKSLGLRIKDGSITTSKLADGAVTSEKISGTILEGVLPAIDFADLDTTPASVEAAVEMVKDKIHTRYCVTSHKASKVGVLDIFSDNMRHQLTEVLTSHVPLEFLKSGDYESHLDAFVTTAYRSYNINTSSLNVEKGAWTTWKLVNDKYLTEGMPIVIQGVIANGSEVPADESLYYNEEYHAIVQGSGTAGQIDEGYYGQGYYLPQDGQLVINLADNTVSIFKDGSLIQIGGNDDYIPTTEKGVKDGVAPLDSNAQIPEKYLPNTFTDVVMLCGLYVTVPSATLTSDQPEHYFNTTDGKLYVVGTEEASVMGAMKYVWKEDSDLLSTDRLYCDVSTNSLYRYQPATQFGSVGRLVAVGGSSGGGVTEEELQEVLADYWKRSDLTNIPTERIEELD